MLSNVESSTAGNADVVVEVQPGWTPAQVGDALEQGRDRLLHAFQSVAASSQFTAYPAGQYDFVANSNRAKRSTRCAAVRAGSSRTSSCCSRPG